MRVITTKRPGRSLGEPTRSLARSSGLLAVLAVASRPLSSRRVQRWLECRDPRLRGFRADRPGQAQAGDHEDDPDATEAAATPRPSWSEEAVAAPTPSWPMRASAVGLQAMPRAAAWTGSVRSN